MRRRFQITLARQQARSPPLKSMSVVRLPSVVLPHMSARVRNYELPGACTAHSEPFAVFYPGASVGVEVDACTVDTVGNDETTIVGGNRVRLLRERPSADRTHSIGVLQRVVDVGISPARAAKLADEAMRANELKAQLTEQDDSSGLVTLHTEALDPSTLSIALAARLPLTPSVLAGIIESTCPLARLQAVVDAMRLLVEPLPRRPRDAHRFRLRQEEESGMLRVDLNGAGGGVASADAAS